MKQKKRWIIVLFITLAVVFIAAAALLIPTIIRCATAEPAGPDPETAFRSLAKEHKELTYDKKAGYAFVNDRIIVIAAYGTPREEIETVAEWNDAVVSNADDELGIYTLRLNRACTLNELNERISDLMGYGIVEAAYVDPVVLPEEDTEGDEDIDRYVTPVYPSGDPWNGASWNVDVPRDANWGMEAIRAPRAWAFLDELQPVRVGLIDNMVNLSHPDLRFAHAFYTEYNVERGTVESIEITNRDIKPSSDGHGSHVAGIMAATWNDVGVSGVLGDKAELCYSCSNSTESRTEANVGYHTALSYFAAIRRLVDNDVRAINISQNTGRLLGYAASRGNKKAVAYLEGQAEIAGALLRRLIETRQRNRQPDFVVCVAAGNNNTLRYHAKESATFGYIDSAHFSLSDWFSAEYGNAYARYNNFLNLIEDEVVKSRIIVVGSVRIDKGESSDGKTKYAYSDFSNIGSRVDICAPGEDVYSCLSDGYGYMSGTSMSTPHVTGAAAMLFAANPNLSGPSVKRILTASTYGRYYYTGGYSGLLDLNAAVQRALQTREQSVNQVLHTSGGDELDLCFVVDTTGSMEDDIDNAKANMRSILDKLGEKSSSYRVAVVDYRDFSSRSGYSKDYPASTQLAFTDDDERIQQAINNLALGNGGDTPETVYSGIVNALALDWRPEAKRVIILIGDAPPLDPEPVTGYTYDSVAAALYYADVHVDASQSDSRVLGDAADSLTSVYSIFTSSDSYKREFFDSIAAETGGECTTVENADAVSDAINASIEKIEITPAPSVTLRLGRDNAGETAEICSEDDEYLFSVPLDENGRCVLENMEPGEYTFAIERLALRGSFRVTEDGTKPSVKTDEAWYGFALRIWHRHKVPLFAVLGALILAAVGAVLIRNAVKKRKNRPPVPPAETAGLRKAPEPETLPKRAVLTRPITAPDMNAPQRPDTNAPQRPKSRLVSSFAAQPKAPEPETPPKPEAPEPETPPFCMYCGTKLEPGSVFCSKCGNRVN